MATSTSSGNTVTNIPKGTTWSTALLELLGAPTTGQNYQFLNAWATREHGASYPSSLYANNPFFTTAGGGGTVGPIKAGTYPTIPNTPGVASYPNVVTGDVVTAEHIATQYPGILQALKSGNPEQYAGNAEFQKELSAWSGSGYSGLNVQGQPGLPEGPATEKALSGGQVAGLPSGVTQAGIGSALSKLFNALGPTGKYSIPGILASAPSATSNALTSAGGNTVASWLGLPALPANPLVRGAEIVGGAVLILLGIIMIGTKAAASSPVAQTTAAGRVAKGALT